MCPQQWLHVPNVEKKDSTCGFVWVQCWNMSSICGFMCPSCTMRPHTWPPMSSTTQYIPHMSHNTSLTVQNVSLIYDLHSSLFCTMCPSNVNTHLTPSLPSTRDVSPDTEMRFGIRWDSVQLISNPSRDSADRTHRELWPVFLFYYVPLASNYPAPGTRCWQHSLSNYFTSPPAISALRKVSNIYFFFNIRGGFAKPFIFNIMVEQRALRSGQRFKISSSAWGREIYTFSLLYEKRQWGITIKHDGTTLGSEGSGQRPTHYT